MVQYFCSLWDGRGLRDQSFLCSTVLEKSTVGLELLQFGCDLVKPQHTVGIKKMSGVVRNGKCFYEEFQRELKLNVPFLEKNFGYF